MTIRKTEIIEWSTTPAELRRIADEMDETMEVYAHGVLGDRIKLFIHFDEGQWQAEQAEGKE